MSFFYPLRMRQKETSFCFVLIDKFKLIICGQSSHFSPQFSDFSQINLNYNILNILILHLKSSKN